MRRHSYITSLLFGILILVTVIPVARAEKAQPNLAVRPVPQTRAWWTKHHQTINQEVKERGRSAELIFIGDSLTSLWRFNGRRAWRDYYRHRKALNLGAAGDQIQHALWRLQNGNLQGLSPKLAVLMVGVNNIYQPVDHVVAGLRKTITYLRRRLPRTRVLVLGILPYGERPGRQRIKIGKVNETISRMADDRWIHFLDIGALFVKRDGTISRRLMTDYLHLTPRGYELWAGAMEPKVVQLMDEDLGSLVYWRALGLYTEAEETGTEAAKIDMDAILARAHCHGRFAIPVCLTHSLR